jgi:hypothetical protein
MNYREYATIITDEELRMNGPEINRGIFQPFAEKAKEFKKYQR